VGGGKRLGRIIRVQGSSRGTQGQYACSAYWVAASQVLKSAAYAEAVSRLKASDSTYRVQLYEGGRTTGRKQRGTRAAPGCLWVGAVCLQQWQQQHRLATPLQVPAAI
jgi:hypothetical protein